MTDALNRLSITQYYAPCETKFKNRSLCPIANIKTQSLRRASWHEQQI